MTPRSRSYSHRLLLLVVIELTAIQLGECFVDIFMSEEESERLIGIPSKVNFMQNGSVEEYTNSFVLPLWNVSELFISWQKYTELPVHYSIAFPNSSQYESLMGRPTLSVPSSGLIPKRLSVFSVNLNCTPEALRDWRRVEFDIVISIAFRENTTELKLRRAKLCSYGNHTSLSASARVEIIRKTVSRGTTIAQTTTTAALDRHVLPNGKATGASSGQEKAAEANYGAEKGDDQSDRSSEPFAQTAARNRADEQQWSGSSSSSSAFTYYVGIACSSGVIVVLALCFAICYVYQKRRVATNQDGDVSGGTNLALVSETTVVPLSASGVPTAMHTRNTLLVNLSSSRLNANTNLDVRLNSGTTPWSSASSNGGSGNTKRSGKHRAAYLSVPFHSAYANPYGAKSVPNTPRLGGLTNNPEQFQPTQDAFSLSSGHTSASHPNSRASHNRVGDSSASVSCANSCAYSPAPPPTPNGNEAQPEGGVPRSASRRSSHSHHSHSRYVQQVFAARRRMLAAQRAAESDATYQLSLSLPPPPASFAAMSDTQSQFSAATGCSTASRVRPLRLAHACAGPPPSCGSSMVSDGASIQFAFGSLDAAGPCATSPLAMSVVTSLSGAPYCTPNAASGGVPIYSELCSLYSTVRVARQSVVVERSSCVLEGTFGKLFAAKVRVTDKETQEAMRLRFERSRSRSRESDEQSHDTDCYYVLLKTVNEVGVHVHDEQIRVLLSDASLLVGCTHTNVAPLLAAVLNEPEHDVDDDNAKQSRMPMLIYPLPAFGILKLFLLEQASQFSQQNAASSRANWLALVNEELHGESMLDVTTPQRESSRKLVFSRSKHGTVAYRGGLTTQQQLVMMSIHVLRGLMYLHRHHLFHGDVATRNCFVDANLTVKLCDNALSRDLFPDEYNCLCDNLNRPIKWLAPETIQNFRQYTVASEMWSFGVLLWELLTKAQLPYLDLDPFEVFTCLYEGYRLPQPYSCPDDLYNFMLSCWTWQPAERPTPHQMLTNLNKFYAKLGLFL